MRLSSIAFCAALFGGFSGTASADFATYYVVDPCNGCTYPVDPSYPLAVPPGYPTASSPPLYYGGDQPTSSDPITPGDDLVGNEEDFDILNIGLSKVGDFLTVSILTRFADGVPAGITYGDLLIATSGWNPFGSSPYPNDTAYNSGTVWNWAVQTSTGNIYQVANNGQLILSYPGTGPTPYKAGQFVQVDASQATPAGLAAVTIDESVQIPDPFVGNSVSTATRLEYVIPLSVLGLINLDPDNPQEIALRWAMTCANDIVETDAYIPEPGTLSLVLGGLVGLRWFSRRKSPSPLAA